MGFGFVLSEPELCLNAEIGRGVLGGRRGEFLGTGHEWMGKRCLTDNVQKGMWRGGNGDGVDVGGGISLAKAKVLLHGFRP